MRKSGGFLLIDKPLGLTSFDVVRRMRRAFSYKKVGHAGTLDPQAGGLLICAFGPATRLIRFLSTEPKVYEFALQFGSQTDSLDSAGKVIQTGGPLPEGSAVETVMSSFIGSQLQVPPVFSALKIGGERAYRLARSGKIPEMRSRKIEIYSLVLLQYDNRAGRALCRVACSGGTYVRSLARDIAARLGTFGYAASIKRISCGRFNLAGACRLELVTEATTLLSIQQAFDGFPCLQADQSVLRDLACGRDIVLSLASPTDAETVLLFIGEELAAVCSRVKGNVYHPSQVFIVPQGALHEVP